MCRCCLRPVTANVAILPILLLTLWLSCLQIFKRVGWVATRLLLVPGIIEAFFDGGLVIKIFGMPATFAFAVGFIMKAVGPALVIQCMFEVQQKRLGTAKSRRFLSSSCQAHSSLNQKPSAYTDVMLACILDSHPAVDAAIFIVAFFH